MMEELSLADLKIIIDYSHKQKGIQSDSYWHWHRCGSKERMAETREKEQYWGRINWMATREMEERIKNIYAEVVA